jgi:hypothetical protein
MYAGLREGEFQRTSHRDSNVPSPVEERRTHDSSWEDDLYEPVRSYDNRLIADPIPHWQEG